MVQRSDKVFQAIQNFETVSWFDSKSFWCQKFCFESLQKSRTISLCCLRVLTKKFDYLPLYCVVMPSTNTLCCLSDKKLIIQFMMQGPRRGSSPSTFLKTIKRYCEKKVFLAPPPWVTCQSHYFQSSSAVSVMYEIRGSFLSLPHRILSETVFFFLLFFITSNMYLCTSGQHCYQ